jgi:hypothetical protein
VTVACEAEAVGRYSVTTLDTSSGRGDAEAGQEASPWSDCTPDQDAAGPGSPVDEVLELRSTNRFAAC